MIRGMTFAQWLQAQLDDRGWTIPELSRRSGIPYPTVHAYVRGTRGSGSRPASRENLDAIAGALGLPATEVAEAAGIANPDRPVEERDAMRWAALGKDLSEQDRRTAERILREFRRGQGYGW